MEIIYSKPLTFKQFIWLVTLLDHFVYSLVFFYLGGSPAFMFFPGQLKKRLLKAFEPKQGN